MTTAYLSQTEAATRLGLTRQRIGQLIQGGRIKAKTIGGRPLIPDRELTRFAALPRKGGRPPSKG